MEPNKENIQKWVDALRSGLYPQGYNYLEQNGKFCCLGVACRVAIADGLNLSTANKDDIVGFEDANIADGDDYNFSTLPAKVSKWLGINNSNPGVATDTEFGKVGLTILNDSQRFDFDAIAQFIEDTYLKEQ